MLIDIMKYCVMVVVHGIRQRDVQQRLGCDVIKEHT